MSKREYRRFTAEQKIEILREADQPCATNATTQRRNHVVVRCVVQADERFSRIKGEHEGSRCRNPGVDSECHTAVRPAAVANRRPLPLPVPAARLSAS